MYDKICIISNLNTCDKNFNYHYLEYLVHQLILDKLFKNNYSSLLHYII